MSRRVSRNSSYTSGFSPSGFYHAYVVGVDSGYLSVKIPRLGLDNVYYDVPFTGFVPAVGDRVWVSFIEGDSGRLVAFVGASDTSSDESGADITAVVAGTNLNGGGSSGSLTISLDDSITLSGDVSAVNASLSGDVSAVNASLSGDVSAVNVLLSGKVSAEIGSFFTSVGIGTASPASPLEIAGVGAGQIRFEPTPLAIGSNNDGYELNLVGGTPDSYTNAGGRIRLGGGARGDADIDSIIFMADTTERMRIDSSGNVGIGTSAPGYRLDVVGAGRFAGDVSFEGDITFNNNAIVSSNASITNIDHIWHDDNSINGLPGTWHFVSDGEYKSAGSSMLEAGGARIPMRLAASTTSNVTIIDRTYAGGYIKMTSTASRTVTVQSRPAGTYKQGDQITVIRENTGAVSFAVAAGLGNTTVPTIKSRNGDVSIAYRYSAATLICDSNDGTSWYLIGDLT